MTALIHYLSISSRYRYLSIFGKLRYHEALEWLSLSGSGTTWSNELFVDIQPVKVPILEQSFALFDGRFARHFFGEVLTEEYVHQRSDWWLDYLWCQVAFGWDEARPGCLLVPVVIVHANTGQLFKNKNSLANFVDLREDGLAIRHLFSDHPTYGKLLELSSMWSQLSGRQNMKKIEKRCTNGNFDAKHNVGISWS